MSECAMHQKVLSENILKPLYLSPVSENIGTPVFWMFEFTIYPMHTNTGNLKNTMPTGLGV